MRLALGVGLIVSAGVAVWWLTNAVCDVVEAWWVSRLTTPRPPHNRRGCPVCGPTRRRHSHEPSPLAAWALPLLGILATFAVLLGAIAVVTR